MWRREASASPTDSPGSHQLRGRRECTLRAGNAVPNTLPGQRVQNQSPALAAYQGRDDLAAYGSNGLLLFALQLRHGVQDIEGVAVVALTDQANDKKCDLVYVDRDAGRAIVAQAYVSDVQRAEAPANKASDLNTAVSWLLSGGLDTLPEVLQSAAAEVRDAVENDEIRDFEVWYVHNLPESANVRRELEQAATTADSLIKRHFPNTQTDCAGLELGIGQLDELYRRTEASIAVTDTLQIDVSGGFQVHSDRWRAFTTEIPATWLRELWSAHAGDLMSPNVRDYLGVVRSERNINNAIKTTARDEPGEFWIYNNGLTVLVNDLEAEGPREDGSYSLTIHGIGIVNGAQTTGSIGTLVRPGCT